MIGNQFQTDPLTNGRQAQNDLHHRKRCADASSRAEGWSEGCGHGPKQKGSSARLSERKALSDQNRILRSAQRILLVDWANRGVPRALVEAGFTVFCASPGRYSVVEVAPEPPAAVAPRGG